jgi:putative hydrolase of the HAD superfamily
MLRLICFDLGGVLVRIVYSWQEACARADLPIRPLDSGGRGEAALELWSLRLHAGQVNLAEYCAGLSAALERVYSAEEIEAAHHAWVLDDYPGVDDVVRAVRGVGMTTALLSNTNDAHFTLLRDQPVVRLLDHLFLSYELGLLKPGAGIYGHVEESTGLPPETIGFFDDTAANVEAARERGWRAELIDPNAPTAPQMREHLRRWQVLTD